MSDYRPTEPDQLRIELWEKIFKHFPQVEDVKIEPSSGRLSIIVTGGRATLSHTAEELNKHLFHKKDPCEVATLILKDYPVLDDYRNTLVGYFDIIAYSEYLKTMGMERVICKMEKVLSAWKNFARASLGGLKIDPLIYASDSILLVLDTNRRSLCTETVKWFLGVCSYLMGDAMKDGFPLRGAIGGGDFRKSAEIIVSTALVDAVYYEKEQDWLGAVVTPRAVEIMRNEGIDLSLKDFNGFVRFGSIPWKNRERTECYYVKPYGMWVDPDWVEKYIPPHFDKVKDANKIANSHCLYGQT